MITIRPAAERGVTRFGWLDSRHTFSFGEYHDPRHMGFRSLRVINDDRIAPGAGFDTHGHRDMEILSYVLSGGLEHKDSMGNGSIIRPGELQFMRAGTGVLHSEFNPSQTEPGHFLQIWILPDRQGLKPAYGQLAVDAGAAARGFTLVASGHGEPGAIEVRQDVRLSIARPTEGQPVRHALAADRHAWLHVARGTVTLRERVLGEGDGGAFSDERQAALKGGGGGVCCARMAYGRWCEIRSSKKCCWSARIPSKPVTGWWSWRTSGGEDNISVSITRIAPHRVQEGHTPGAGRLPDMPRWEDLR